MQRDMDYPVYDIDGDQMRDVVKGEERPATVKRFVVNALAMANQDRLSGDEKMERYALAMRINHGAIQEFTAEQLAMVMGAVASMYPPLIVGQVFEWAEGKASSADVGPVLIAACERLASSLRG